MEDNFKIIKNIDEGAFGIVLMAKDLEDGEIVAIKKIKRKYQTWEECVNLREVKSLRQLNHQNIIKLKKVLKITDELFLVFEYVDQNIFKLYEDFKKKGEDIPESFIKSIIYQTASGLSYMHKNNFFHRDMKPENLLINKKNILKIADFGLAREIRSLPPYTDYVSTRWYRAPEILLKSTNYNSPVDIFALGCIMVELYNMNPLFRGQSEIDQLNKIISTLGTPPQEWARGYSLAKKIGFTFPEFQPVNLAKLVPRASPDALDLIRQMLQYQPSKRPTADQILKHPYFTNSMVKKSGGGVWGGKSIREQAYKKTYKDLYQNSTKNIFSLQNNSKAAINKFSKNDNDWELDDELDDLINDQIPDKIKADKGMKSKSNYNLQGGSSYTNNGSFLASNKKLKNSAFSKKQSQPVNWNAGESSDDFDVFNSKKKNEPSKAKNEKKKIFNPGDTFGDFGDDFFDTKQKQAAANKKEGDGEWNHKDNPFGNDKGKPTVTVGNGWEI